MPTYIMYVNFVQPTLGSEVVSLKHNLHGAVPAFINLQSYYIIHLIRTLKVRMSVTALCVEHSFTNALLLCLYEQLSELYAIP